MEHKTSKIHGRGGVSSISYCLVWTPKRRAAVLKGQIAEELKTLFAQKAAEIGVGIITMEVAPDRVRLLVSSVPKLSPHSIVKKLKVASSKELRGKYPQLAKLPCLWSSSYYCGSVGQVSESVVKMYIEGQKGR